MDGIGGPQGSGWNFVPVWDGKPETFSHFIHEVKWSLTSSRKEDRALLGAKIIRKALQSGQPTLVQLMYKLEPSEFTTEGDVNKLISFLESSPLNRQALPDAGNKIGSYYRRLRKRPSENVPAFLIREDRTHDEMMRALQRLLHEKELDLEQYDTSIAELKAFCGIREGHSLYFGPEAEGEVQSEADAESQASHGTSRTATPAQSGRPSSNRGQDPSASASSNHEPAAPRGKDLLQRLMDKGLIPLAALDVIRGWMLLEMATASEEERRIIRAATQNRLSYSAIRSALLSMYEEKAHRIPMEPKGFFKGKGKAYFHDGFYGRENDSEDAFGPEAEVFNADEVDHDYAEWWQDPWSQDAWWQSPNYDETYYQGWEEDCVPEENPEHDEVYAQLIKEQEEAEKSFNELQALAAENERNLMEARRAVQAASRDRGWGQPPQQRQPKFTSSYPGKGKKKGTHVIGKGKVHFQEDLAWMKGQKGSKGYAKNKGFSSYGTPFKGYKGSPTTPFSMAKGYGKDSHYMHMNHMSIHDMYAGECDDEDRLKECESIIDTGATATAGGQWAVQQLCTAVMRSAPDATMELLRVKLKVTRRIRSVLLRMANAEQKAELKQMMRELLQEVQQPCLESQSSTDVKAKAKPKTKGYKTVFDETRQSGPDMRDPRMSESTWPCYAKHRSQQGNNRYGRWTECAQCGVRLSYTPARDAPGQTTHTDLPQNVIEALHRLRTEEFEATELNARQVKAMITIVAKEKILFKKGASTKAKVKAKAVPVMSGENVSVKDSSDEENHEESGFSLVKDEKAKKMKEAPKTQGE
eukprot:s497_g14.t1